MSTATSKRIQIDRTDSLVLFRLPTYNVYAEKGDKNIEQALKTSRISAIIKSFPIAAMNNDSTAVLFDATSFFSASNKDILNIRGASAGGYTVTGTNLISGTNRITDIDAFNNSISISLEAGFSLSLTSLFGESSYKPEMAAGVIASLTLLPEEKAAVRTADPRIGTQYVAFTKFDAEGGTKDGYFAARWKLEPKDPNAIKNGRLSEPVKPITFYVDTLFTESWYQAIKSGLEKWNPAFEKAGYKNAIHVERYPADSTFHANDPLISCVRYGLVPDKYTIGGRFLADPRTGEILSFNLTVPRDYAFTARRAGVYLISDVDPRYQEYFLSDDAVCEVLTADIMRKVGLGLGLTPNYAGGIAYDIDQLRDPEFTQKYGFTASVTDEILFNYAALPGDKERGVALILNKPGVYDEFAIQWLYSPIYGDEKETLNKWLMEKAGDPRYFYGKEQRLAMMYDPRAINGFLGNGDLGSDIFATAVNELSHLKYVVKNSPAWLTDDRIPAEEYKELFPEWVFLRFFYDVVYSPLFYVGGIYQNEYREGSTTPSYQSVPKALQKKAMKFVLDQCKDYSWMDDKDFLFIGGPNSNASIFTALNLPIRYIFSRITMMPLSVDKSEDPYTQEEALDDLADFVFADVKKGGKLSQTSQYYVGQYISNLIARSTVLSANYKKAKSSGNAIASDEELFPEIREAEEAFLRMQQRNAKFTEKPIALNVSNSNDDAVEHTEAIGPATLYFYFPASAEPLCYNKLVEARQILRNGMASCSNDFERSKYRYYIEQISMAIDNK